MAQMIWGLMFNPYQLLTSLTFFKDNAIQRDDFIAQDIRRKLNRICHTQVP